MDLRASNALAIDRPRRAKLALLILHEAEIQSSGLDAGGVEGSRAASHTARSISRRSNGARRCSALCEASYCANGVDNLQPIKTCRQDTDDLAPESH
jgi:hypothetical protein